MAAAYFSGGAVGCPANIIATSQISSIKSVTLA